MLHQIYYGDKVKEDKMGGACGTRGRDDKSVQNFVPKN